jgi:hypothetical protein
VSESIVESERVAESERIVAESVAESVRVAKEEKEKMKAANAEFETWFDDIIFAPNDIIVGFTEKAERHFVEQGVTYAAGELTITLGAYANKTNIRPINFFSASVSVDGNEYSSEDCYETVDFAWDGSIFSEGMAIEFPELTDTDIDSLSITFADDNGKKITLTHYAGV